MSANEPFLFGVGGFVGWASKGTNYFVWGGVTNFGLSEHFEAHTLGARSFPSLGGADSADGRCWLP